MATPKLRFKEFNDNWLKVDIQSLVDEKIIDKPMDGNHGEIHPTSADYVEDGIPFVMATDVIDGKVYLDKSKKIKKSQADGLRKGFSLEGDILLTHKATIGNVAKVPELKTPYIMLTPQVTYYRVLNKDKLNQDFIKSTFEAPVFQNALLALCTGATRLYIGISEQRKLPFSYPSKKEQTKIAAFLSAVDEKISQLTQKLHLLGQYKQGMMKKLFSQQIRFKADDGSQFEEWVTKTIKELNLYISDGNYGELYPTSAQFVSHGVPFIRANNIKNLKVTNNDMRFIDENLHQILNSGHLKTNDIIVTTRGDIGMVALVDSSHEGSNINAQICLLRVVDQSQLSPQFLLYFLDSSFGQKQFKELQTGTALKQLPKKSLDKIITLVPSINEQTKIANFLSSIDQKIDVVSEQLEQAKLWKKGLLQQMFV